MKTSKALLVAGVGAAAFFIFSRRANAGRAAGPKVEADTDRIVDSIPGAGPAPMTGSTKPAGGGILPPVIQATGQVAAGVAGVVQAGVKALGAFFGQGTSAGVLGTMPMRGGK